MRPVMPEDHDFMLSLYDSTRDDLDIAGLDPIQRQQLVRMQFMAKAAQYRQTYPKAEDNVVMSETRPVGRMMVNRADREITLVDVALLPEYRNLGIGTKLVRALTDEASRLGKIVRLRVLEGNAAIRVYERLGFARTNDDGTYLEMKWTGGTGVKLI